MSALAGLWNFDGAPTAGESCQRMLTAQAIYGPDAEAIRDLGDVALGRRLFITVPEDVHDRQPLAGGDGRFALGSVRAGRGPQAGQPRRTRARPRHPGARRGPAF